MVIVSVQMQDMSTIWRVDRVNAYFLAAGTAISHEP